VCKGVATNEHVRLVLTLARDPARVQQVLHGLEALLSSRRSTLRSNELFTNIGGMSHIELISRTGPYREPVVYLSVIHVVRSVML
jgi:hypothetical protein